MTPARDCGGRLAPSLAYELKRRWKDGATHVVMTLELLIERLLALVPAKAASCELPRGIGAPGRHPSPKSAGCPPCEVMINMGSAR